jgi:hypothetical protein
MATGGSPQLVADMRCLDQRLRCYRDDARRAAELIGTELVPVVGDSRVRSLVLRTRRVLHRGQLCTSELTETASVAEDLLPTTGLSGLLGRLSHASTTITAATAVLDSAVAAEEQRLLALPWSVLGEHAVGQLALLRGDIALYDDINARLAAGEPWNTKRMRQRSDYLWRMLARATTRATPRGWLAHVAVVPIEPAGRWVAGAVLPVSDIAATENTDNVDEVRQQRMVDGAVLVDDDTLACAPLAWRDENTVSVWVLDGENRRHLARLRMRRTPLVDAVWAELATPPTQVAAVLDAVAGPRPEHRAGVRTVLQHLVGRGVLHVGTVVPTRPTHWAPVATQPVTSTGSTFTDVYRLVRQSLATTHASELDGLVSQARRVLSWLDSDRPDAAERVGPSVTTSRRPLLDVVADWINQDQVPDPVLPDLAVSHPLRRWLHQRCGPADSDHPDPVDLDVSLLDRFDLPDPGQVSGWPMDALLRPCAGPADGPIAVLADLAPAGVLDARFLPALTKLGQSAPQLTAYREFLARLSELAGVPFVELLIPPLSKLAANAIRRPGYTELWTGDPDRGAYVSDRDRPPSQYLPLADLTVRRDEERIITEFGGREIWPVLHTARTAAPPWDAVRTLLLAASPQTVRAPRTSSDRRRSLWPGRAHTPRLTMAGRLVLAPATWRIDVARLASPDDRLVDRMRQLVALRDRHRWPRWVTVNTDPNQDPVTVDLDSVRTVRVLDRLSAGADVLTVAELVPGPDELAVADHTDAAGQVTELLLRLPVAVSARDLATRVARQLHRTSASRRGTWGANDRDSGVEPALQKGS